MRNLDKEITMFLVSNNQRVTCEYSQKRRHSALLLSKEMVGDIKILALIHSYLSLYGAICVSTVLYVCVQCYLHVFGGFRRCSVFVYLHRCLCAEISSHLA